MEAIIAGRQPGAHRRQRIVQQHGVGDVGAIVAGEPDLVHPVVERQDAVGRHHLAHVVHEALRCRRPAVLGRPIGDAAQDALAQLQQGTGIVQPALDAVGEKFQAGTDVTDDLGMREIHLLDVGRAYS